MGAYHVPLHGPASSSALCRVVSQQWAVASVPGAGPPPVHLLPDPDVRSGSSCCSARAWVLHILPGEARGHMKGPWTTLGGEAPAGFSRWTNSPVLLSCSPLSFPDSSSDFSASPSVFVPLPGSLLPRVHWVSEGCIVDKESSSTASERSTWGWKKGGRGKCVLCKACCVIGQHSVCFSSGRVSPTWTPLQMDSVTFTTR